MLLHIYICIVIKDTGRRLESEYMDSSWKDSVPNGPNCLATIRLLFPTS